MLPLRVLTLRVLTLRALTSALRICDCLLIPKLHVLFVVVWH
jgi:hypothetical protein